MLERVLVWQQQRPLTVGAAGGAGASTRGGEDVREADTDDDALQIALAGESGAGDTASAAAGDDGEGEGEAVSLARVGPLHPDTLATLRELATLSVSCSALPEAKVLPVRSPFCTVLRCFSFLSALCSSINSCASFFLLYTASYFLPILLKRIFLNNTIKFNRSHSTPLSLIPSDRAITSEYCEVTSGLLVRSTPLRLAR